jgi:hypothetical protein
VWSIGEAFTGFWWGNLSDRDRFGDPGGRWEGNKMDLQSWDVEVWTGLRWLRIGMDGGHM